jgi:hypothetical protein
MKPLFVLAGKIAPFDRFPALNDDDDDDSSSNASLLESEDVWFLRSRKMSQNIPYPTSAIAEHFVNLEFLGNVSEFCPAVFSYWPKLLLDFKVPAYEVIRKRLELLD